MSTAKQKRDKRRAERPPRVVVNNIVWELVEGGRATEPAFIGGKEVRQRVDVKSYCYRMLCACGRERYSQSKALHEVTLCRICHRTERLARRRAARKAKAS